jgi:cytochrome c oxidase subunit 2
MRHIAITYRIGMMRVSVISGALTRFFIIVSLLSGLVAPAVAQQYAAIDTSAQPLSNKICATCHGAYGMGNPVVGAPSLAGLESWYLKAQLIKFRDSMRGVQKDYIPGHEMRAAVAQMSEAEMDGVIAFIESWDSQPSEATVSGDAVRGADLYASCAACHGVLGAGNQAVGAPGLAGRDDWYLRRQLKLFQSGYRGRHPEDFAGAKMRTAAQLLKSDQDIDDVLVHIGSLH